MQQSDPERALATILRWAGVAEPTPEYGFDPDRRWRLDLAWPELRVGVEVEGGTWTGGRHTRGAGFEADCVKYNEAAIRGWTILRVTSTMIDDGRALDQIERALRQREERHDA